MAHPLMRERTLAQRRCSQSLCFIRPRRGDSNFFLDPWHSKAPTAITLPVAPSCVITPMAISNPAGMSLASGPSVELASAQGLSLSFSRSGPWLTENVGQLCLPIQPLHTRRVIKPSVPLTGTNPEPRPALERHSMPTAMPWTDIHKRISLTLAGSMWTCSQLESRKQ